MMLLGRTALAATFLALSTVSAVAGPALDAMSGRWTSQSTCSNPGEWRVFGNEIEFAWPGVPVDVERVLSESGNRIETIGISPQIDGNGYTYVISDDRNTVSGSGIIART
jgi:hypothetical protein